MNTTTITKALAKAKFGLKKRSPEILVIGGIIGGVASAVMACKATTKAQDILAETKKQVEGVHQVLEDPNNTPERYSEEDSKKDLLIIYTQTAVKLAKTYAPAVGLGALSIVSILGGHKILRGRNVALAAAYATIDQSFKEYRSNVVERFGETVDKELRYNLKAKKITETVTDEDGKSKKVKKEVLVPAGDGVYSGYARSFEPGCEFWENDANLNRAFLASQQEFANQKLQSQGYLFLSDVYKALGFRDDKASHCVGWVYNEDQPTGDNYVDFGFDKNPMFMSGYENSVILDFNVDGPILDTFEEAYRGRAVC